jgi:metal-responsive CopG/Arc/MetJ family transcriptional regulator
MKNLNITISNENDQKLDVIMQKKQFKNRADAVAWLIETVSEQLKEA